MPAATFSATWGGTQKLLLFGGVAPLGCTNFYASVRRYLYPDKIPVT